MEDFCTEFSMDIANGATPYDDPDTWTYKNSWGHLTRLDYILHSKSLRSFDKSANDELHLGSDHRNVSASIEFISSIEPLKFRKRSFKGWKLTLNDSQETSDYHLHLEKLRHECPPANSGRYSQASGNFWRSQNTTSTRSQATNSIFYGERLITKKKKVTRCSRSKDTQQKYS